MEQLNQENYREYNAINYSKLSALDQHPSKVGEEKEISAGMEQGDILDLFCYDGEEAVHDKYHVSSLTSMPTDIMKDIVDQAENYEDATLIQTARDLGYGSDNWNDSTILRHIEEKAGDYMLELENAGDKPIISWDLYVDMQRASNLLLNHQFTQGFFGPDWDFQKPIAAFLPLGDDALQDDVEFKGLLDGIKENDNSIMIHDLKFTSGELSYFPGQFMSYRYYIQASLYSDLVAKTRSPKPVVFYNVVYSRANHRVQAFKITPEMIEAGREGFTRPNGTERKGYKQLADDFLWHNRNNRWDYPRDVYENNGVSEIKLL